MSDFRLRQLTATFLDPAVEADFRRRFATRYAGWYRVGALFLPALFGLFALIDPVVAPEQWATLWAVRGGIVGVHLAAAPLFFAEKLRPLRERWLPEMVLAEGIVALGGTDLLGTVGARSAGLPVLEGGAMGLLLGLAFLYCFARMKLIYAAPIGILASAGAMAVLALHPARTPELFAVLLFYGAMMNAMGIWVSFSMERLERQEYVAGERLKEARARSDALLRNALPEVIAQRLRIPSDRPSFAERHSEVTVVAADVVGFTALSERLPLDELGSLLDRVFSAFDELCAKHGVEKIKTLGDGWLGCAGAPGERADHARAATELALEMRRVVAELSPGLSLRIGVATGPVVGGVIGRTRFAWDLWGPAVADAVAMEQGGAPGRIRVSTALADRLGSGFPVVRDAEGRAWL